MFSKEFVKTQINTQGARINVVHAGKGEPLLLLHGYPQTHCIWHEIAPQLAQHFHVICADLRGYGDSSISKAKDVNESLHEAYSKKAMAKDMIEVMAFLGHEKFSVAGHDRGGRVVHRMALDYPKRINKACVMDIAPTEHMFNNTDKQFATGYYHWFFLIQGDGLPEKMIGADPEYYLREKLNRWSGSNTSFDETALAEYIRCFKKASVIHASCEDYRAAATIDLTHDKADSQKKISCPLLVLWGEKGFIHQSYDVLNVWRQYATKVEGKGLDCGHFLPEEQPKEVEKALLSFLLS